MEEVQKVPEEMINKGIVEIFETVMMYPADQITRSIAAFGDLQNLLESSKLWKENGNKWSAKLINVVAVPETNAHYLTKNFEDETVAERGYDRRGSIELTEEGLVLTLTVGGIISNPIGSKENKITLEELSEKGDSILASGVVGHLMPGKLRAKLRNWQDTVLENVGTDEETGKPVYLPVEMKSKKHGGITACVAHVVPQEDPFITAVEYKMSFSNKFHEIETITNISTLFSVRRTPPKSGVKKAHSVLDIFIQHIFKPVK